MAQHIDEKQLFELKAEEQIAIEAKQASNGDVTWQPAPGAGIVPEDIWESLD